MPVDLRYERRVHAGVTEFEKYIPTFFANRVRIENMSHSNPLKQYKHHVKHLISPWKKALQRPF